MTKKFTLLTFFLCVFSFSAFAQTVLMGKVVENGGDALIGAAIVLKKNDVSIKGVVTDYDGNYKFSNIDPGTFDVEVSSLGLATQKVEGVVIKKDGTTKLDFNLIEPVDGTVIDVITVTAYKIPLIDFDQTTSGNTVTAESIANSPLKGVQAIAATSAGLSSDSNGNISVRGSRNNATHYYVDGLKVSAAGLIPTSEVEQLQVITGGLGAKYGDVTGGVISLTSKGPSERFSGGIEAETSQFLDPYGYNFLNGSLSGPLMKKEGKSVIGFRVNAQYVFQEDDRPSAGGVYRMPKEVIEDLEANPIYHINDVAFPRAELLGRETLSSTMKTRPNEERFDLDITGKIDARLSKNLDVSLSGIIGKDRNRFDPGGGFQMFNWTRNPYSYGNNNRLNFRWRHKVGRQELPTADEEKKGTMLLNASYIIQLGRESISGYREDAIHENNFFNYGLYGSQEVSSVGSLGQVDSTWGGAGVIELPDGFLDHTSFTEDAGDFSPFVNEEGDALSPNPVLGRYLDRNGDLLGATVDVWGSRFFDNVGRIYNNYRKFENVRNTVNIDAQIDLIIGGDINNSHNIQFGANYELRNNRRWSIAPRELWNLARDAANSHFVAGVDTTRYTGNTIFSGPGNTGLEFAEYGRIIEEDDSKLFYSKIRELYGLGLDDYFNIDASFVDHTELSLDMFSARELISWRDLNLDYYGYDYLGNVSNGNSFDDFFKAEKDGKRTFPVAALQPVYVSGYIQDKFQYEDIILRVGVRADYYDANTKVLRDPFSLYTIENAGDFSVRRDVQIPSSLDPEAKVYLDGNDLEKSNIKAFRVGDQWFAPDGTATDGNLIFGNEPVNPSYQYSEEENNIKSKGFTPGQSFVDYDPSFRLTPRISLSFPISEDAGFFAHYDQLVQRPPSNTKFTALDYYFFEDKSRLNRGGGPANNPNLRPETTIDYEVGFQQKISNSSAIKLSAFYRENRDMIQSRYLLNVPIVNDYLTYDNIDFGTVKGFTASYDLRRTENLELSASYTLQYAEGTGSSSNSGLSSRNGEVRVLIPLTQDERHRLVGNIDYRFASGDMYTGPRLRGFQLFANTGLNLQVGAVSGRPYTKNSAVKQPFSGTGFTGEINGARLPWNINVDARLDRNFKLKVRKDAKKGLNLNVYLRISNLFDTRNVVGVYSFTGSPDDDGFLKSVYGEDAQRGVSDIGKDVESYLAAYEWALLNPGFYSLPRRIRLGAMINF